MGCCISDRLCDFRKNLNNIEETAHARLSPIKPPAEYPSPLKPPTRYPSPTIALYILFFMSVTRLGSNMCWNSSMMMMNEVHTKSPMLVSYEV